LVKEVSIVPIISSSIGNVVDKKEISNKDVLSGLGAVSWWKLDGNANDEIGNNGGTLQGGMSFVDGKFGEAGSFNGVNSYINVADSNNLDINNKITIMLWFNVNSYTNNHTILIGKRNDSEIINKENYGLGFRTNFTKWWTINNTGGFTDVIYNQIISKNNWHNIAVIQNDNSQEINFYLDGNLVQTNSTTNTLKPTSGNLGIGAINFGNGPREFFNGEIDEVIIFNQSLTAQQIKSLSQLDLTSS
jgi:hypothetical protein